MYPSQTIPLLHAFHCPNVFPSLVRKYFTCIECTSKSAIQFGGKGYDTNTKGRIDTFVGSFTVSWKIACFTRTFRTITTLGCPLNCDPRVRAIAGKVSRLDIVPRFIAGRVLVASTKTPGYRSRIKR